MEEIIFEQFNHKIPQKLKSDFQLKVLKNKAEYKNGTEVIIKLLKYFNRHGLPDKEQ